MQTNETTPELGQAAGLSAKSGAAMQMTVEHSYHVECWRPFDPAQVRDENVVARLFDCPDCKGTGREAAGFFWRLFGVLRLSGHNCHRCVGTGLVLKRLVWADDFHNLVTTAGKNKYLDATLKTGLTTPVWYLGLVTGPGGSNIYAAADTSASHAGWSESTAYSNSNRVTWTPGSVSAGSVDNSGSPAVFNINATATIAGAFMIDNNTKGGATGTLLGVGNFTGGDRAVQSGDTLTVTVTATQS